MPLFTKSRLKNPSVRATLPEDASSDPRRSTLLFLAPFSLFLTVFRATDSVYAEVQRVLQIMIPRVTSSFRRVTSKDEGKQ